MRKMFLLTLVTISACVAAPLQPIAVRLSEDSCAHCRMSIISTNTAAQLVVPGEEPVMFDEIECLRKHLTAHPLPDGAAIFVADHRTGEWVDAREAVFTTTATATPMGSGLLAHRDAASRDADPAAKDGSAIAARRVLNLADGIGRP